MFLKGHPAWAALAHTLQIMLKIEYLQLNFVSHPNFLIETVQNIPGRFQLTDKHRLFILKRQRILW